MRWCHSSKIMSNFTLKVSNLTTIPTEWMFHFILMKIELRKTLDRHHNGKDHSCVEYDLVGNHNWTSAGEVHINVTDDAISKAKEDGKPDSEMTGADVKKKGTKAPRRQNAAINATILKNFDAQ